jgi:CheY-like chemotaxis protein
MTAHASIVCVTSDPALRRSLRRTLFAVADQVDVVESLEALLALATPPPQLLIVDAASQELRDLRQLLRSLGWQTRIVTLGRWSAQEEALSLLDLCHCENLITRQEELDEAEVLITASKLLGGQDIFGLEKYLAWGVSVRAEAIRSYDDKRGAIEAVTSFAREIGCRRQLLGRIEIVVDELLMNALYDAPASHTGDRRRYVERAVPGGGPVSDRTVTLRFACDGRHFALSVQDEFGGLRRDAIVSHLNRAVSLAGTPLADTDRGAGLGLYFILSSVSRFVVNVDAGIATEVICLFDLRTSPRDAASSALSFNVFMANRPPVPGAGAAPVSP